MKMILEPEDYEHLKSKFDLLQNDLAQYDLEFQLFVINTITEKLETIEPGKDITGGK